MCRSIRTLYNFKPPATGGEIRSASLQFVRKLSGMNTPSRANEAAFARAIDAASSAAQALLVSLTTHAAPRNRESELLRPAPSPIFSLVRLEITLPQRIRGLLAKKPWGRPLKRRAFDHFTCER